MPLLIKVSTFLTVRDHHLELLMMNKISITSRFCADKEGNSEGRVGDSLNGGWIGKLVFCEVL
jgi:hypothetical protein